MEFDELYQNYFKPVYQYIRRLSGDDHIAEEMTSEAFFKAMKSTDDFRGECDIQTWIFRIAKNTYCSYLKKSSRTVSVEEAELLNTASQAASIEEQVSVQDEARRIREILHKMSEPYKEVFMWRVFGELSFKEIGALYRKTDNWACVTYHRARKMLQSRLEEIEHEK